MTREERRQAMPVSTAFLDDIREAFGDPCKLRFSENGHSIEWGESPIPEGKWVQITPTWKL